MPATSISNPKITKTHFGVYGSIIKNGKIFAYIEKTYETEERKNGR